MTLGKLFIRSCALFLLGSTSSWAAQILIAEFTSTSTSATQVKTTLEAQGHTVDVVDGTVLNSINQAMGSNSYDQLFIFDVTTTNFMSNADLNAINQFYLNKAQSVVLDTQSYNYLAWDKNNADGLQFLTNVASELAAFGGGIYLGADHPLEWTTNTNAVLERLGMDTVAPPYISSEITAFDATSPLFAGVNPLSWRASSYGVAISGMQNGQYFDVLASDGTNPLITASFVQAVPVPAAVWLFGSALAGLGWLRRRQTA